MAIIANCLNKLVKAGRVTRKAADDALAIHEGLQGRLIGTVPPASADAAAALEAAQIMADAARERKLSLAKTLIARQKAEDAVLAHTRGINAGLMAVLTRDITLERGGSVFIKQERATEFLLAKAREFIDANRSKIPGFAGNFSGVRNAIRERFGEDTGDPIAKEAWGAFDAAIKAGVERLKRAGKVLTELDDWGTPQQWSTSQLRKLARTAPGQFQKDMIAAWQRGGIKIMDRETGDFATDLRVPAILQKMEEDIKLGIPNRSEQMRVIRFQDANTWWEMNSKYGTGETGAYGLLVQHLQEMGREIGLVEVLGADHAATFRHLHRLAQKEWADKTLAQQRTALTRMESPASIERTYRTLTGETSIVESELIAGIAGGMRNMTTAGTLGGAVLVAVPGDAITQALKSSSLGMGASRPIRGFLSSLTQSPENVRKLAARLELTAHAAMDFGNQAGRFEDAIVGTGLTARFADMVIRGQGLKAWTDRAKVTFSMEVMSFISENFGRSWDNLDEGLRAFFVRNEISPEDWDTLRKSKPLEAMGAEFFDPAAVDRELAEKVMGGILDERFSAVLEPDARVRQFTTGGAKRGTFVGDIVVRNIFQFKNFPITFTMTHLYAAMGTGPMASRPFRTAGLVALMSIAGGLSLQARNILSGKDPEDMTTSTFWKRAFAYGGGMGFWGDLAFQAESRTGSPVSSGLAGPPFQMADDTVRLLLALNPDPEKPGKFGKQLAKTIERWTPGSNLWYSRLAADRYLFDFLQTMADSEYRRSFAREEQRVRQNTGQEFWWRPGSTEPRKAPDFGAAIEGLPPR